MEEKIEILNQFERYLREDEKAERTIAKYRRDASRFLEYVDGRTITKEMVLDYKKELAETFQPNSANSMLAPVNLLLQFLNLEKCRVRKFRIQKEFFSREEKHLTQAEYEKLVQTEQTKGQEALCLIMQTICSTGIRIGELHFITREAACCGSACITHKGKTRMVLLPEPLRRLLMDYCEREGLTEGVIFRSGKGTPIDRSVVWRKMKKICADAGVEEEKVYPHNLRHLFAITFYRQKKDIVALAEILGHASVETTRIYTRITGKEYGEMMAGLGLVCGVMLEYGGKGMRRRR